MLQLIKKDLLVALKMKSIKNAIVTFIIALVLIPTFSNLSPTIIPLMITYILVMNSFYYDSINNNESYMLSLPNRREDVVYSKYILVLLVLFLSNLLIFILFSIYFFNPTRVMVIQDVLTSTLIILLTFSIVIPSIFKLGYKVSRNIGFILVIALGYRLPFSNIFLVWMNSDKNSLLFNFSDKIMNFIYKLFKLKIHDLSKGRGLIYIITIFFILFSLYIISMYISLKLYKKREMA